MKELSKHQNPLRNYVIQFLKKHKGIIQNGVKYQSRTLTSNQFATRL